MYSARDENIRNKRIVEAYSLMNDILSSKPVTQPTPNQYPSSRPLSPRQAVKEHTAAGVKRAGNRGASTAQRPKASVPSTPAFPYARRVGTRERTRKEGDPNARRDGGGRLMNTKSVEVEPRQLPIFSSSLDLNLHNPPKKVQFSEGILNLTACMAHGDI